MLGAHKCPHFFNSKTVIRGFCFNCLFVCFAGELALAQNGRVSIIVSRTMQESTVEQKYTLIPVHSSTKSDQVLVILS